MVLKLISIIILIVFIAFFSGFNLQNTCDIWFFGFKFQDVPVFLTALVSFAAGIFITLPAVFFKKTKKLTSEQARAQAERIEKEEKMRLENQLKREKRLAQAREKALKIGNKKNGKNAPASENSAPQAAAENPIQEEGK